MWLALGKKHETLPEKITKAKRVGGLSCRSKGKVHYPHPKKITDYTNPAQRGTTHREKNKLPVLQEHSCSLGVIGSTWPPDEMWSGGSLIAQLATARLSLSEGFQTLLGIRRARAKVGRPRMW
jgi:hypothetical protein